jgi:hypothetical protein
VMPREPRDSNCYMEHVAIDYACAFDQLAITRR